MNPNRKISTLAKNQIMPSQPELMPGMSVSGHGARHPPRKRGVQNADTVIMLMSSARKNIANLNDEYSVWKPPTSSDSASGRSNGARLVSPAAAMQQMMKLGSSRTPDQLGAVGCQPRMSMLDGSLPAWALTSCEVDIVPAVMNTATMDRPIATSYEIICAPDRRPPSSG